MHISLPRFPCNISVVRRGVVTLRINKKRKNQGISELKVCDFKELNSEWAGSKRRRRVLGAYLPEFLVASVSPICIFFDFPHGMNTLRAKAFPRTRTIEASA